MANDRIVVVLDPHRPTRAALLVAARFARVSLSQVQCVFIEDTNLARLGAHAAAREVTAEGARIRMPDSTQLERQLAARAREVMKAYENAGPAQDYPRSFMVLRGQLIPELTRFAAGARMVVIGWSRPAVGLPWWDAALPHLLASSIGDLAFVPDEAEDHDGAVGILENGNLDERLSGLANSIASATGLRRVVRLHKSEPGSGLRLFTSPHQRDRIRYLLLRHASLEPAQVREYLRRRDRTVIVVR